MNAAAVGVTPEWRDPQELEALLPAARIVTATGSIDRYGFLHVLADRCEMRAPRRAFADWVHGWMWDDKPTVDSMRKTRLDRNVPVVVRNESERRALLDAGFVRVEVGGLPFAYVPAQHSRRHPDALLAFPPHSAEVERLSSQQQDYMDYLASLRQEYDGIFVSIFHLDWNGPIHEAVKSRGLHAVQGARPDDANSLYRMRALFDAFTHVTSNNMGSHFVYALHSGCSFSFCGPMFAYDAETFLANGNPHGHSQARVSRLLEIQESSYLRRRFGHFFPDHPRQGVVDHELGANEVGVNHLLEPRPIRDILGWTLTGQVKGYSLGALRRVRRLTGRS